MQKKTENMKIRKKIAGLSLKELSERAIKKYKKPSDIKDFLWYNK